VNKRLVPLLATTLALGACNARVPTSSSLTPRYASLDSALDTRTDTFASPLASRSGAERPASAVVMLPAWIGRPTRLREHDDAETFEQAVSLDSTLRGETQDNRVLVTMPRSRAALDHLTGGTARVMGKPTEAGIRAELDAAFPGVAMQVVTRPASNSYGPYGLAIGRGRTGARCLYAWQWIAAAPALEAGGGEAPLSLRVRLCRSNITLEAMAAAVNQLRLVPRFAGSPVAAARMATTRPPVVRHGRPHPVRVAARRAEPAPYSEVMTDRVPAEQNASGRRYLGTDPTPSGAAGPPVAVPTGANALRSTLAGLGGASPVAASGAITADLPPEAYRGPVR
jgi:hypothetical protein